MIEVDISDTDISVSHRIPLSNNGEAGPRVYSNSTSRYSGQIYQSKDSGRFYKARTKLKSCTIRDIGLERYRENNIFIQESLTEVKRKLFKNCLKFRKEKNYKFIWTYYGVIYLRRNEHTPASRITSVRDLERLQPRLLTSESMGSTTMEVSASPR